MFSTAVIVFREALEAALIIGIVLAAARGVAGRFATAAAGVGAGLAGAVAIAMLAGQISEAASGVGQEIVNASILGAAVLMLGWHNVWMSHHAREVSSQMRALGGAVASGTVPLWRLGVVVALAVMREGAEIVLFVYGIAAAGDDAASMFTGGLIGLGGGVAIGTLLYQGLLHIPLRHFFTVTSVVILMLAAGLAAQSAGFLVQAGLLPTLGDELWDSSWLIDESSVPGQLLRALVGYVARPTGVQLIAYLSTLTVIGVLMLSIGRPRRAGTLAAAAATVSALTLAAPHRVEAAPFTVYSPGVEKGENEIEFRGYVDDDNNSAIDGGAKQVFAVGRGMTQRWFSEVYAVREKSPGGSMKTEAFEWENRFQLTEAGQYWADFGVQVEYERAQHGEAHELALLPIIEKTSGPWVTTINLKFERGFGADVESESVFAYAARVKYLLNPKFEPAIEFFGEPGNMNDMPQFDDQEHWVGPAFYGTLKTARHRKIVYSSALLFGATDVASDRRIVFRLEYEFR